MLLYLEYPVTSTLPPAIPNFKKSPRLSFLDTGIINFVTGAQLNLLGIENLHHVYQGRIVEHVVSQELRVLDLFNNENNYFWTKEKKQSNAEVDFILPFNYQLHLALMPIEVKAGKTGTIRSLHQFMNDTNHPYAIRLSANFISKENVKIANRKPFKLLNLPYYLTCQIKEYINWFTHE